MRYARVMHGLNCFFEHHDNGDYLKIRIGLDKTYIIAIPPQAYKVGYTTVGHKRYYLIELDNEWSYPVCRDFVVNTSLKGYKNLRRFFAGINFVNRQLKGNLETRKKNRGWDEDSLHELFIHDGGVDNVIRRIQQEKGRV